MRLTEYFDSINNGIQDNERYSHIDIKSDKVREEIKLARRELKKQPTLFD